jgi:protein-S-isoprenylcysteine O-methyltransferase Ste14
VILALKVLVFTVLVPGVVAGYLPYRLTRGESPSGSPWAVAVGGALLALGVAGYLWTATAFATVGRGTPFPLDAPRRLVVVGLHRHVRNPMYLSVLTVVAGWATLYASRRVAGYLAIVAAVFHVVVIALEEPVLQAQFGEAYSRYREHVPRWVPRRHAWNRAD